MGAEEEALVDAHSAGVKELPPGRLPVWEVSPCFKCPIIGTCLSMAEQRRLLKKTGLHSKKETPFELHETLVAAMDRENRLSRKIDNLLDKKYGRQAAALLQLDEADFLDHFKTALAAGDAAPALWATATGTTLSMTTRRMIFGQVHMSMHWNGEQLLRLKRKLSRQADDNVRLQARHRAATQKQRSLKNALKRQEQESEALRKALAKARAEKVVSRRSRDNHRGVVALEKENRGLGQALDALESQLALARGKNEALEKANSQLLARLEAQHAAHRRTREEIREIIDDITSRSMDRCDASCPSFDLCKKRILIVGGVTRMEGLYRDLIEGSNGVFEYHDGYVKKGARNLECRLKRADVVLCPVNCNSHAACSLVKNLGKKHKKTVHILANGSLSAVSQVIWGSDGRPACTLN